ncbi:MAG: DNRLRE domain-containing protein [Chitinophagales bacterium]
MATKVFTPTENVYISEYYYYQNFSGTSSLYCGQFDGSGDIYRSILGFNLDSLPDSSTITDAKLKLFIYRNDAPALSRAISIYQALSQVPQNIVTYANQPLTPGTPEVNVTVTDQINTYLEFDVKDLVNGWYTGSIPNCGIVVESLETSNAMVGFRNKYYDHSNCWPLLEVDYVKGLNVEYPVENVVTTENWVGSNPIPLGPRIAAITVVNTGPTYDAAVELEISPDGVTWAWAPFMLTSGVFILTPLPATGYVGDSAMVFNTTGYTGAYARISYVRRTGHEPTTLSIYATTTEG